MAARILQHLFNVGVVDNDKEHRVDLEKLRLAAREQTNLIPTAVGPAFVRPGTQYLGANYNNGKARLVPFVSAQNSAFIAEMTEKACRIRDVSTDQIITRPAVTASVQSGDFSTSTGWTLGANPGTTVVITGGTLRLTCRALGSEAYATQAVTINETGVEHALEIHVTNGPVVFRLGSFLTGQDIIPETTLREGSHSLSFTPTVGTVYIKFSSQLNSRRQVSVGYCQFAAAGPMVLSTPYYASDLSLLRWDQSLDILFMSCRGYRQRQLEHHADHAWSLVIYEIGDGPFLAAPTANVKLSPNVIDGNGQLTASAPFFTAGHLDSLFALQHNGQRIDSYIASENQYTPAIKVTGVNEPNYNDRDFTYTLAGTWSGSVNVSRSFDSDTDGFQQFRDKQGSSNIPITTNVTNIDDDNDDNAETWYRLGIDPGNYTSGEVHITIQYAGGQGYGVCRVTNVNSSTSADIEVITPFKGQGYTADWQESFWSQAQVYPSAVALAEGRLFWFGDDKIWGSISDEYYSFDETFVGDAGPISRSVALGGRNEIRWALSMSSLILGCDSRIAAIMANTIGDDIDPENFKVVHQSKIGVAPLSPTQLADDRALFVERAGSSIYELNYDPSTGRYLATPFSQLTTDMTAAGITEMAVSTLPDQRIWVLVQSGDAVMVLHEPSQQVTAFITMATRSGDLIESVCVVPGTGQDRVYFSVARTINGTVVRYTEKLALDVEAKPNTVCKVMDAHISGTGFHAATITGLDHLNGCSVVAWVDGAPVTNTDGSAATFTVVNGSIILPVAPRQGYCVGLPFNWSYETARLEYGAQGTTPFDTNKSVTGLGLKMADYVRSGIMVQTRDSEGNLSRSTRLPKRLNGKDMTNSNVILGVGTDEPFEGIPGGMSTDQRLRLSGQSPFPARFLAMVLGITQGG